MRYQGAFISRLVRAASRMIGLTASPRLTVRTSANTRIKIETLARTPSSCSRSRWWRLALANGWSSCAVGPWASERFRDITGELSAHVAIGRRGSGKRVHTANFGMNRDYGVAHG